MEFDYNENMRIVQWVLKTFFKRTITPREDLLQQGMLQLWKVREQFDQTKGKYFYFAKIVCKNAMLALLSKEKKHYDNLSLDYEFADEIVRIETIPGDEPILDNYNYLQNVAKRIIDKHKSKTFKKINTEFIKQKDYKTIAKEFGITNECVRIYAKKFKILFKEKLIKEGYYENNL